MYYVQPTANCFAPVDDELSEFFSDLYTSACFCSVPFLPLIIMKLIKNGSVLATRFMLNSTYQQEILWYEIWKQTLGGHTLKWKLSFVS